MKGEDNQNTRDKKNKEFVRFLYPIKDAKDFLQKLQITTELHHSVGRHLSNNIERDGVLSVTVSQKPQHGRYTCELKKF